MPPRRRAPQITAAGLPASRLPVGTPRMPSFQSSTASRPSSRTSMSSKKHQEFTSHAGSDADDSATDSGVSLDIPQAPQATSPEPAAIMSLAEAKLQRQNERIEKAEAVLNAPLPLERERQVSRKSKIWKPFDYTAGSSSNTTFDTNAQNSDSRRLNVYQATSRASSLNRSMSSLSQRTVNSTSENERQGSGYGGGPGGFQLYARKNRRHYAQLSAYEEKSPEHQSTVEATFDEREIYEVFGNALPGPEFIEQNVGFKNGQLQFAQHPNGDVSAHQWSIARYMWENIGQFSNIRKKIEGQLAADRLKGETAYQTVQRHTLAYFRTIARQREAAVMGITFGAKEIQAGMPDLRMAPEVPTGPRSMTAPNKEPPRQMLNTANAAITQNMNAYAANTQISASMSRPYPNPGTAFPQYQSMQPTMYQYSNSPTSNTNRFVVNYPFSKHYIGKEFVPSTPQRYEDPFYSTHAPQNPSEYVRPAPPNPEPAPKPSPVVYNSFGAVTTPDYTQRPSPLQPTTATPQSSAIHTSSFGNESTISMTQQKVATPLQSANRTAMRNQLIKLGDQAKERSTSQSGFRTVAYDPLRSESNGGLDSTPAAAGYGYDSPAAGRARKTDSEDLMVALNSTPVNTESQLAIEYPPTKNEPWPYPEEKKPRCIAPIGTSASMSKPTPQSLESGDFFPNVFPRPPRDSRPHDVELNDWWTSGRKFHRQDEFFEKTINLDNRTSKQSPTKKPNPHSMTRLLIPVLENLSSYVQGPIEKRRDYFSQWTKPPEWCIDRSIDGNKSFYDKEWGQPPARVGRDPRYQSPAERLPVESVRFGAFSSPQRMGNLAHLAVGAGIDRRFLFHGGRM